MLELKNISKSFQSGEKELHILENLSLHIAAGESVAIVGPSGSGKSTLLSLMAGLDQPTSGKVFLDDLDLTEKTEDELATIRNQKIGYIFQAFELLPSFTAVENVLFPLQLRGEEGTNKATEMLAAVGLEGRLHHFPHQLSGGEQQRVAIARAFIHDPEIVFADEPTGNLDDNTSRKVLDLLFSFVEEQKKTLVLITHDKEIAKQVDRVLRLHEGKLTPVNE